MTTGINILREKLINVDFLHKNAIYHILDTIGISSKKGTIASKCWRMDRRREHVFWTLRQTQGPMKTHKQWQGAKSTLILPISFIQLQSKVRKILITKKKFCSESKVAD